MNPADLRLLLMEKLNQAFPFAVTVALLRGQLAREGQQLEATEITEHLRTLSNTALVDVERDPLDSELRRWRLTEKGRSWLKAQYAP
jgi:DNA-binding HxlR family transcriptional regulator